MVFVDSNFWIGFLNIDDKHSKRASELSSKLENAEEKIYVTSGIIHEVVSHLFKTKGKTTATRVLTLFLSTPNIEILFLTDFLWRREIDIFVDREMDLTDAQIVAAMEEKHDLFIFSFDSHFDQIREIKRIY